MIIGVDLDDVLADFVPVFLTFHNKKHNKSVEKKDVFDYSLQKIFNYTRNEVLESLEEFYKSVDFTKIIPVEFSVDGVETLRRKHELYVITSRLDIVKKESERWIDFYFPDIFSDIVFSGDYLGNYKRKAEICKDLGVDVMIEDSLRYSMTCAQNCKNVLLFDQPWNQCNDEELPGNVSRIYSWIEILDKVNSY